jgi:hypothetical protein
MKSDSFLLPLFGSLALLNLTSAPIQAADTPAATSSITSSPPAIVQPTTPPAPVQKLPYGADDVLKLSQGKVSEDIILTYVQTSGRIYDLKPHDIVTLKQQGVSDKVVNAMLDQRRVSEEKAIAQKEATDSVATAAPFAPEPAAAPAAPPPFTPEPIADYPTPAPVEVIQPPVSTLYVIPYSASGYRPYYRTLPSYGYYGSTYVIRAPGPVGRVSGFGRSFHSHWRR